MTALPDYSGPMPRCIKCGGVQADTEWHPHTYALSPWGQITHTPMLADTGEPGWLLRRCSRCRYQWAEATEDARVQA